MSFLLILIIIKFFLNRNVVDVLPMVVSGKILPSISLGHAIHVSHSCQYKFSDAVREAALWVGDQPSFQDPTGCVGWSLATGAQGLQRWLSPPSPATALPATISFNHCRRHGTLMVVCTEGGDAGRWA